MVARGTLLGLAVYALVSALWTWPLVTDPAHLLVARHFDAFPVAWLAETAPGFLPDGVHHGVAWPEGEALHRVDSFVLLGLALMLGGKVPGLLVVNLLVLLGPVVSAWGAQRFVERALGVAAPASLVAGLLFGFAPLALVAILEGHVYVLFDPWLPLMALACWEGRPVAAAVHFALALLTTAYLGVDAALVAVTVLLARRDVLGQSALVSVLGALATVGLLYTGIFVAGGAVPAREAVAAPLRAESATLTTLLAWTPWVDLARHSLGPALGMATLVLGSVALRSGNVLADDPVRVRGLRVLGLAGLASVLLALGPWLELGIAHTEAFSTPLSVLDATGVFEVFRFPIRFAWVAALLLGALASLWVSRRSAVAVRLWLGLVVLDVLVASGAPWRVEARLVAVPSLYGALSAAPVLELHPEALGAREDLSFYHQNLACFAWLAHRRPILDRCLNTDLRHSPRVLAARELHAALLAEGDVRGVLTRLRVGSVVLHADLYAEPLRGEILRGLNAALGSPSHEGRDGGAWLIAWEVPPAG